jgi:hypothetical protein
MATLSTVPSATWYFLSFIHLSHSVLGVIHQYVVVITARRPCRLCLDHRKVHYAKKDSPSHQTYDTYMEY